MRGLGRLRRAESIPWLLLAAMFVTLSVLIGVSIANFASVADTHAQTSLSVRSTVAYAGLASSGRLADNGTVALTIFLHVDDPTSRRLSFFTVGYKVWVEDVPTEKNLGGVSRIPADISVTNATGRYAFYPVFDGSIQTAPFPVPARGNATMPFPLNLTKAKDPDRFAALQNITEYAVKVLGGTPHMVWNVWVLVNVNIDGIPAPSSISQADYFTMISRVQFIEGVDFGQAAVTHA